MVDVSSPLLQFAEDRLKVGPEEKCHGDLLWSTFKQWCKDTNHPAPYKGHFLRHLERALQDKGVTVYDHWDANGDPTRRLELKRMQRGVDVFLTSMNAVTVDGVMVNLDGGGNRVAGTCSGPKRVIVVVGANKVVENVDAAIHRTRHHASPLNAIRLERETPCVETGTCNDCSSPQRICAMLLIMYKKPGDIDKFTVVLVNDEMGY